MRKFLFGLIFLVSFANSMCFFYEAPDGLVEFEYNNFKKGISYAEKVCECEEDKKRVIIAACTSAMKYYSVHLDFDKAKEMGKIMCEKTGVCGK